METASNTSDTTPGAMARVFHTPSNAGHTSISYPVVQLAGDVPAISQQSISIAPPLRAVLRKYHRLTGSLADNNHGTTLTSTSSAAGSISDAPGTVSALPHSLTATPPSSDSVASRGSAGLPIVPAHAVPDTPSPSLPIPVTGNMFTVYSRSFQTSGPTPFLQRLDHSQQTILPLFSRSQRHFSRPVIPDPLLRMDQGDPAHLHTHLLTVESYPNGHVMVLIVICSTTKGWVNENDGYDGDNQVTDLLGLMKNRDQERHPRIEDALEEFERIHGQFTTLHLTQKEPTRFRGWSKAYQRRYSQRGDGRYP
ncbi:hypothetical protein BJY52DRAFT_1227721 [Lactarius psammicola]|nr:hypothetical protein BJY52DRAFT_1227721 [Lactarius psammicola]